jgi:hypothetical protein
MRIVPARHGITWLRQGWGSFRRSPMAWLALVSLYWFLVALLNQVPYIGPVLATIFLPAFSVSFMTVTKSIEGGQMPALSMLWAGFLQRTSTLITLGGLYLIAMLGSLGLSALADGGVLFNWIVSGEPPAEAAIRDGRLASALIVAGLTGTPILMAFWFSPVLAAWRGMGAAKSLFYSFFASLRNWRAFLMYGMAMMAIGMLMSIALTLLAVLFGGNAAVLRGIMLGLTMIMLPTVFASFYFGYREVFPEDAASGDPGSTTAINGQTPPTEDQPPPASGNSP